MGLSRSEGVRQADDWNHRIRIFSQITVQIEPGLDEVITEGNVFFDRRHPLLPGKFGWRHWRSAWTAAVESLG